jgi:hypothetical protein
MSVRVILGNVMDKGKTKELPTLQVLGTSTAATPDGRVAIVFQTKDRVIAFEVDDRAIAALRREIATAESFLIERDYPHFVDMEVPPGGLGSRLDAMYAWHTQHGVKAQRSHGRHDADRTVIRWCFADADTAAAFAAEFKS